MEIRWWNEDAPKAKKAVQQTQEDAPKAKESVQQINEVEKLADMVLADQIRVVPVNDDPPIPVTHMGELIRTMQETRNLLNVVCSFNNREYVPVKIQRNGRWFNYVISRKLHDRVMAVVHNRKYGTAAEGQVGPAD